jgi:hypothetical protein
MPFDEVGPDHEARFGLYDWRAYKARVVLPEALKLIQIGEMA